MFEVVVRERKRKIDRHRGRERETQREREGGLMFDTLKAKDMSSSTATRAEWAGLSGQVNVGVAVVGVSLQSSSQLTFRSISLLTRKADFIGNNQQSNPIFVVSKNSKNQTKEKQD